MQDRQNNLVIDIFVFSTKDETVFRHVAFILVFLNSWYNAKATLIEDKFWPQLKSWS